MLSVTLGMPRFWGDRWPRRTSPQQDPAMKIGLCGTPSTGKGWEQVWKLIRELQEEGVAVFGSPDLRWAFSERQREAVSPMAIGALYPMERKHLPLASDLLIVFGGREALLQQLGSISEARTPTLLVGEETVFPATEEDRLTGAAEQILRGTGTLDSRMLLETTLSHNEEERRDAGYADGSDREKTKKGTVGKNRCVGAEEVVFQRTQEDALLRIDLSINGHPLTSYEADGLVISTPTGSAARSLSAGGPLVVPGTESVLITPMASHTLTTRPILVSETSVIEAKVQSRSGEVFFRVDRSTFQIKGGDVITVRSTGDLRLVDPFPKEDVTERVNEDNTATTIRQKENRRGRGKLVPASTDYHLRRTFPFPRRQTIREKPPISLPSGDEER